MKCDICGEEIVDTNVCVKCAAEMQARDDELAVMRAVIGELNSEVLQLRAENARLREALTNVLLGFQNGDFRRTHPRRADTDPYHPALVDARAALEAASGK